MPKKAVFLDRDGVLNEEKGYIVDKEGLTIFPFAKAAVRRIHQAGFLAVVVTNQSAVARGLVTENKLKEINSCLIAGTGVDAVYYCPHLIGGAVLEYALPCRCRKPGTGMIEQAVREMDISLEGSWMVGDRDTDIIMGRAAGLKTAIVMSGFCRSCGGIDASGADIVCRDLLQWTEQVLPLSRDIPWENRLPT